MVKELIERLERRLSEARPAYFAQLEPGVSDKDLKAFEDQFSLRLPEAFRCLYLWRNGQSGDCSESLAGNRMFCRLNDIAASKDILDSMIGEDFDDPRWWRVAWVPFLSNGGGDYLCLDVAAEDGGRPGQLVAFWHDRESRPVEFEDVGAWLASIVSPGDE